MQGTLVQLPPLLQLLRKMGISKQIGWGNDEKLLYEIYNKFEYANELAYKWTQGNFHQQGTKLNYFNTRVEWDNTETDPAVDVSAEMLNYFRQIKMVALNAAGEEVHTFATWNSPTVTGATDGSLGQVTSKLPKLYVKIEYDVNGYITAYTLRSTPAIGFTLHECFWDYDLMDGTKGRDYIYVGSYEGYISGGKLHSRSGVVSTGSQIMSAFRTAAQATFTDGNGHQLDFYTQELIQLLFYAYYGTRDSQTALPGYTERAVYNGADFRKNGRTDILTTVNGYVNAQTGVGELDADLAAGWQADGRGTAIANRFLFIENIFGAKWKFLDGCSFDGRVGAKKTAWVHPDPRKFTSVDADVLTNYIDLNIDVLTAVTTSWIGGVGRGFIPLAALGADSEKYYCDFFYSYLSDAANRNYLRSVLAGGSMYDGTDAGLAARLSVNSLAISSASRGSLLMYKPNL